MDHRNGLLVLAVGALIAPYAAATHNDGTYEQPNWFTWFVVNIDVFVVPAEHGQIFNGNGVLGGLNPNELLPCSNSYTLAMMDSIQGWNVAIAQFAAPWLQAGLHINTYLLGCGAPPPAGTLPEIVVFSDENKGPILGVAVQGNPCLVDNSKFFITSFTYNDMYNINGQEYGHCLGLQHVGGDHPAHDVMDGSYDDNPGAAGVHRHCVSNLNALGVERAFAIPLGHIGGGTVSLPVANYQKIAC